MNDQIYQHYWVTLKSDLRASIAEMFSMRRSVICEVAGNKLVSDGYSNDDLKAINLDSINEKLATKFDKLEEAFNFLVESIENPPLMAANILKTPNEEIKLDEGTGSVPTGGSKTKKGKG